MIQAVLSNPSHPEYGVATIPFPIPRDQYAHCMELLEALEIGDAVKADCKVEKIDSFYTVLKRVEMLTVNVEELNYLAKRLDSFDTGEAAQFQAMAHKLELFELKDLINLTFCCQQATVINTYDSVADMMRTPQDYYDVTKDYLSKNANEGGVFRLDSQTIVTLNDTINSLEWLRLVLLDEELIYSLVGRLLCILQSPCMFG